MAKERRSKSRREVREILARLSTSGLTHFAFAEQEAINIYTLKSWLRRERLEHKPKSSPVVSSQFIAVELPDKSATTVSESPFCIRVDSVTVEVPRDVTALEWRSLLEALSP